MRDCGSRRISAGPSPKNDARASGSSGSAAGTAFRSGVTSRAPTAQPTPAQAKTVAGEPMPSSTPASTGATSTLMPSTVPETTFVAASSRGVRARPGANAAWVGLVIVNATAITASSA